MSAESAQAVCEYVVKQMVDEPGCSLRGGFDDTTAHFALT